MFSCSFNNMQDMMLCSLVLIATIRHGGTYGNGITSYYAVIL